MTDELTWAALRLLSVPSRGTSGVVVGSWIGTSRVIDKDSMVPLFPSVLSIMPQDPSSRIVSCLEPNGSVMRDNA